MKIRISNSIKLKMELKNNNYKWKKNLTYASKSDEIEDAQKEWINIKLKIISDKKEYNCICSAKIKETAERLKSLY
jgi:hypothetical protein